jgi:hypothetical protein
MDKIRFTLEDDTTMDFFVLEKTTINQIDYILVTDEEEGDADAMILKDVSALEDEEAEYETVTDETELNAVAKVFENLLEDITFE